MPTFPLPPLKFRKAGFPRYGFKAGISGRPSQQGLPRPSCSPAAIIVTPALCPGDALMAPPCKQIAAYPRGPRSGPRYVVPVHPTYSAPSAPLAGTSRFHRLAAYTRCLRCPHSHMPRRPAIGSELSSMLFRNMSSSKTTANFSVAYTPSFTKNASLQLRITVSAFPLSSHSDSGEGVLFEASLRLACATTCCFACPPVGADQICIQPTRTFTSGLPTVWSPAPSPDITTVPTGQFALAGLSPARPSTSFTALSRRTTRNAPCADVMRRTRDHISFPRLADFSSNWIVSGLLSPVQNQRATCGFAHGSSCN